MKKDDEFDMPEFTDEMMAEFQTPPAVAAPRDLHLGVPQIQPVRPIRNTKPVETDWTGLVLDSMIITGFVASCWLFVQVWIYALSS